MSTGAKLTVQQILDVTIVNFEESRMLDAIQIEYVGQELFKLVDELGRKKLVLDFGKVQFLASAAIGVLVKLHKKTAVANGQVVLCGLRKELTKVFEIMEVGRLFHFCENESQALALFGYPTGG